MLCGRSELLAAIDRLSAEVPQRQIAELAAALRRALAQ